MATRTRSSRIPKPDERNRTRVKIGQRNECRVFKFSHAVSPKEIEARKSRLKEVYEACGGWNELSIFIASHVSKGVAPVPLPGRELCPHLNVEFDGWVRWRALLISRFPTISWAALGDSPIDPGILGAIRQLSTIKLNEAVDVIASIDRRTTGGSARPIAGSLHEAIDAYLTYVTSIQARNFDRHAKIRQLRVRHTDQPLATLGLDSCRGLFDYWRQRPPREDGTGQYSEKRSREQLAELVRFFEWLHLSEKFAWREPEDFQRLDRSIAKTGSRKSILQSKMPIFSLNDLATLIRHAEIREKLWITWCLNTSHGAAEVGRVQWDDIYLNQDHPWRKDGLKLWEGGNWMGFLRPKTDVLGWWSLWPETVQLLLEWKEIAQAYIRRPIIRTDTLIIQPSGNPLYAMSKNGQGAFAKCFNDLKLKCGDFGCAVADLPPGTLRNQFSDWCGGEEADATVAGVGLTHGIPHKGDKLLYKHYSNRPWKRLFEKQEEFREYCRPVLDSLMDKPPLPPNIVTLANLWPQLKGSKNVRGEQAAHALQVSKDTIYRYLKHIKDQKA